MEKTKEVAPQNICESCHINKREKDKHCVFFGKRTSAITKKSQLKMYKAFFFFLGLS